MLPLRTAANRCPDNNSGPYCVSAGEQQSGWGMGRGDHNKIDGPFHLDHYFSY